MSLLSLPFKVFGWTAAGVAFGVGWKLGSAILDAALGEKGLDPYIEALKQCDPKEADPLWKKKFSL